MIGIVWGATIEVANAQLDKIMQDYERLNIKPIEGLQGLIRSKSGNRVIYENGDRWAARVPNNGHGYRCNIAYIDKNIIPLYVDECIMPCIIAMPYQAIHYYLGSETEVENHN